LLSAVAGFATVLAVAPDYVVAPSLPLDDAWAHAASARALATTGGFDVGPNDLTGRLASPLWAALMAVPHLVASDTDGVVLLTKLLGFALHVLGALILFHVLTEEQGASPERLLGPLLVAFHPDLVSASLSGVEVPLATAAAMGLLWAAQRAPACAYGGMALITPFVRPELAVLSLVFPRALHGNDRARLWRLGGAGLAGTVGAFGLMAVHLLPGSSIPHQGAVPGTKKGEALGIVSREVLGFTDVLDQFPVADSGLLLVVAAIAASWVALRAPAATGERVAAAAMLGGIGLCLVSFAWLPPVIPRAFYAQRYALPALPLLVGAIPILVYEGARRLLPLRGVIVLRIVVPLLLVASEALDAPVRYRHLANDARNVDEIQVAMARELSRGPAWQVVWTFDGAGALRYFGRGRAVDLSPATHSPLAGPDAQGFLDAHRPNFIEIVPSVSSIDGATDRSLPVLSFTTTTLDTVDGTREPRRQRWLVACTDPSRPDRLRAGGRVIGFRCGEGDIGTLARRGS
jgi:hypothetical protein